MGRSRITSSPTLVRQMVEMGQNIRLARLRRNIPAALLSERAGITPPTLRAIERGDGGVSLSSLGNVLFSLGLDKDLAKIAQDDELGRKLQDLDLSIPRRAKRRTRRPARPVAHATNTEPS